MKSPMSFGSEDHVERVSETHDCDAAECERGHREGRAPAVVARKDLPPWKAPQGVVPGGLAGGSASGWTT